MPSRAYWGGFGRGLSSGINNAFKMQLQMDEHKLKARMLEHQMKKAEMDEAEKQRASQQIESIAREFEAPTMQPSGWKIYTQDETSPQFGQEPPPGESTNYAPLSPLPEEAMVKTPASMRDRLIAAQIRMGKSIPSEAFRSPEDNSLEGQFAKIMVQDALTKRFAEMNKPPAPASPQVVGAPTAPAAPQAQPANVPSSSQYRVVFDAKGQAKLAPANNPREPLDIANRSYFEARTTGLSHEDALKKATEAKRSLAGGTAQAPFDVKAKPENKDTIRNFNQAAAEGSASGRPLEAGTRKELSALESAKRQMEIVKENYNKDFLGMVKGTDIAYNLRRKVGSSIGSPIDNKEESFRGALAKAREELIRAKEGAVIPAEMYNKLAGLLPKETDEPGVFENALDRFSTELDAAMGTTTRLGVTPRGQSSNAPQAPQGGRKQGRLVPIPSR